MAEYLLHKKGWRRVEKFEVNRVLPPGVPTPVPALAR